MKKFMLFGLILIGIFGLVSCGGKKSASGGGGNYDIRLLTRLTGTSPAVAVFQDVTAQFDEEYPEVTIVDESQGDESSYNNKLMTDISAGTLPNIFVLYGVALSAGSISISIPLSMYCPSLATP